MSEEGKSMETEATSQPTGSEKSSTPPAKVLRRACDCCRKRKVKCDGSDPCTPCKKAAIRCAYLQPPKKKGPKGLRSARVLHALRQIDDSVTASPTSPRSPEHNGNFGNWNWSPQSQGHVPSVSYPPEGPPPPGVPYGIQTSLPQQDQGYFHGVELPPLQNQHSQPHRYAQPLVYRQESSQNWHSNEPRSAGSERVPQIVSPTESEYYAQSTRISRDQFLPYIQLFFTHMFPIMPVIDPTIYLDPHFYSNPNPLSSETYCFLCALCATTVVQLDASVPAPPQLRPGYDNAAIFAEECLRERYSYDFMLDSSPISVLTSFFLFCYEGNHERYIKAWYFLSECITAAENLGLADEYAYHALDPVEAQWRRRLYWLLFITERAYAIQRRKRTRLTPDITLPSVFESEDPQLLTGFVLLAQLFSAVDDRFVRIWRGPRRHSIADQAWVLKTQRNLDAVTMGMESVTETQRIDIGVTREWLHVLVWQLGVNDGLLWGPGEGGMRLDYPIDLARNVVGITTSSSAAALNSHGIGMEQKLSDIAACLADVLHCTAGDTSPTYYEGKHYLLVILQQLSSIRGKASRYLKPLMKKLEGLVDGQPSIALPPEEERQDATEGFSNGDGVPAAQDAGTGQEMEAIMSGREGWQGGLNAGRGSVEMLRHLSLSGELGIAALQSDMWERRPSGRLYGEVEQGWLEMSRPPGG
nr:hypothetical protein B0A51_06524 [Rachicladosporium sp. CCFEE 5018]